MITRLVFIVLLALSAAAPAMACQTSNGCDRSSGSGSKP